MSENEGSIIGVQRGISFNKEEHSKLQKYMGDIRILKWLEHYETAFKLTAAMNIFIRKQYNDHRPLLLNDRIPLSGNDAGIHHNKVTASGIVGMVNILANQSTQFYNYMSMGSGTMQATIGQRKLQAEEARLSVLKDGSSIARGNVWNHVGNFGYGIRTGKYYEYGIHNGPLEPSKMLARSVLPNGLQQTQNETFLMVSHSMVFAPK